MAWTLTGDDITLLDVRLSPISCYLDAIVLLLATDIYSLDTTTLSCSSTLSRCYLDTAY